MILDKIARSRTVAALASPHGVDHYLSRVHPVWAAHDVRARIVDVRRETDTPGAPVAALALQPTSTWRGHRAGPYVQVGLDLPAKRYPEIAPEVREICERYGIAYTTGPLRRQLGSVARKICRLALPHEKAPQPSEPAGERQLAA